MQLVWVLLKCTWFYIAGCPELGRARRGGKQREGGRKKNPKENKTNKEKKSNVYLQHLEEPVTTSEPRAGQWVRCRRAPGPIRMVGGDGHVQAQALPPHAKHPTSASGGATGTTRTLPFSAGPSAATSPPPTPRTKGGRRGPPPPVTAGTLPASFLPGKHVWPPADATALQPGLAGMRRGAGRAGGAGSGREDQSQHPPPTEANTAALPRPGRTSPSPTPTHEQPPPAALPFRSPGESSARQGLSWHSQGAGHC